MKQPVRPHPDPTPERRDVAVDGEPIPSSTPIDRSHATENTACDADPPHGRREPPDEPPVPSDRSSAR